MATNFLSSAWLQWNFNSTATTNLSALVPPAPADSSPSTPVVPPVPAASATPSVNLLERISGIIKSVIGFRAPADSTVWPVPAAAVSVPRVRLDPVPAASTPSVNLLERVTGYVKSFIRAAIPPAPDKSTPSNLLNRAAGFTQSIMRAIFGN
jgi:hypothetical protein